MKKSLSTRHRARSKSKPSPGSRVALADSCLSQADKFLLPTYKRQPQVLTHGRGAYLFDSTGKKYLDFLGGIAVNALGHAHPRIVKTIRGQASRAIHLSNLYHNEFQGPLAAQLCAWSGLDRVFFSNSGTEAIDGALKLARLSCREASAPAHSIPKKHRILAMDNSFHGRTFGAMSVTSTEKYRLPFAPLLPGVEFVRFNDVADLEAKFDETICAVLVETIQGEGGIHPLSENFWNRCRELTAENGALLIADEIQCGLGRTGLYFAYQRFSSLPDITLVAKPLAAGLPLGAILTSQEVASKVSPGMHGTTFGGGPLVCAVALEFLRIVDEEKLLQNVQARGEELRTALRKLASRFGFIREIRGEGLMIGVELSVEGAPIVTEAWQQGLLINCTHDFTLRFLPPFNVSRTQVHEFLKLFEAVLNKVASQTSPRGSGKPPIQSAAAHATAR